MSWHASDEQKNNGNLSRVSTRGTLTNAYNETIRTHARPSTVAASKTEMASSESVRARATTAVEYGSGLERTERRRAQGHCPPPDARTRARAVNAPDASPPNTWVTGGVIGNKLMSHRSFCSLPTEQPRACQGAGNKDGTSNRDPPRDTQGQRSRYQRITWHPTLDRTGTLPRDELGVD